MTLSVEGARGILEEEWDSVPGIRLLFLLVWCTARGHLPYQQTGFFCLFGWLVFFFFFFLPESIGSDEERVVDVLW